MQFKRADELKIGMRLARPIYNKNGVLLYERESKLTDQSIASVQNFGLIGVYILEPAEPAPILTQDDLEFERFQTMEVFEIRDELQAIIRTKTSPIMTKIIMKLLNEYGNRKEKVNFMQGLRSPEDYVYKHTLNVTILCSLMTGQFNMEQKEKIDLLTASIVYHIGILEKNEEYISANEEDRRKIYEKSMENGMILLNKVYLSNSGLKKIYVQAHKVLEDFEKGIMPTKAMSLPVRILVVAEVYDSMTAMHLGKPPASEVEAMRFLMDNQELFDPYVIDALLNSIYFLAPGTCVELSTGQKGLVLRPNQYEPLRPVILTFDTNEIIDLSNELLYADLEIKDIMKTMDNRYVMDMELLKKQGYFAIKEPVYEVKKPQQNEDVEEQKEEENA